MQQYTIDDFEHYKGQLQRIAYRLLHRLNSPSLQAAAGVPNTLMREPHVLNRMRANLKQALLVYLQRKNASAANRCGAQTLPGAAGPLQFALFNRTQTPDISTLVQAWPAQMEVFIDALYELEKHRPDWSKVVELRVFAGLTLEQIAVLIGKSDKTVRIYWALARGFLSGNGDD